jgi:homoserine dehydrogenase
MKGIAVLGYGTVGAGTVEVFFKNKELLEEKVGCPLDIKYILEVRDFPGDPLGNKFIKDFSVIENDPEICAVAELIGGKTFAYDFVKRALIAGKNVVTSNKELVAEKGAELLHIAREKGVNFFFEASVGGGIPVIRPINQCLSSDTITAAEGILNGTTNFILTKMRNDGTAFSEALKEAQKLGYAERDPTADVEGDDACRKICILASLIFGKHVYPKEVYTEGITKIATEDMQYAQTINSEVKLVACARKTQQNNKHEIWVAPAFVSRDNQLSGVNGVFNGVLVCGEAVGEVMFYGKGAGKYPTASAVISDITNALLGKSTPFYWDESDAGTSNTIPFSETEKQFFVRVTPENADAFLKIFPDAETLPQGKNKTVALITEKIKEKNFSEKIKGLNIESIVRILDW